MRRIEIAVTTLVVLVCGPLAAQQRRPPVAQLKQEVTAEVVSLQKLTQEMTDMIFSFSELGFQEYWTSAYITEVLKKEGFRIQMGVAGMPTGYVASWGSGKPVIGLMADIDGLPETSQKPGMAYEAPLIPGGPGHGEGHNAGQALQVTAAIAVKRLMEKYRIPGELRVYPGVAEELVASRTYMVMAGLFTDVDVMLSAHVDNEFETGWGVRGSGLVSTMYTFHGRTAHGAGSPWAGRSALDAVELMNVGWNYRREHLRLQHRSHYVIPNGGSQPNVVPGEAAVWYYFRELDYDRIRQLHELGTTMAKAAGMMTETTFEERVLGSAWPSHFNRPIARRQFENIRTVGYPQWTAADVALARAAQKELGSDTIGLRTRVQADTAQQYEQGTGGGSDDIAEVSWNLPTVNLRYPSNIPGMTGHHWSSGIAMATPIAHKGASYGARVQAMTAIDLLVDPALLQEAWRYFREVQTKDRKWASLIPAGTEPPTFLNAERMARFRPQLEKLKYDPSRYPTYLEQLGIRYPTVKN
ncbi:MAG TPA: amidohydrolase [Gemmatimonadales bacterium]